MAAGEPASASTASSAAVDQEMSSPRHRSATIAAVRSPDAGRRTLRPPRIPTSMWCAPSRSVPCAAAAPPIRRSRGFDAQRAA